MSSKNLMQMLTCIVKLDRFNGGSFKHWQNKMQFLLATLNVTYVLTKPYLEESEDETLAASRERLKFESDDFICRGHILNVMSDPLFDVYQNYSTARELWNALEEHYFTEDVMKFIVSNFIFLQNEEYRLENKANDDTSKVHIVEEKGESSKVDGKKTYEINLDNVHLSEFGSETAFYELKGLALKHSEKPRLDPWPVKGSAQKWIK
ncbi:hypothetical protein Tco_1264264 [Tanacetum coccineum]